MSAQRRGTGQTDTYCELVIVRETLRVEELDNGRSWRWLHPQKMRESAK
jgi:hypothetical protein